MQNNEDNRINSFEELITYLTGTVTEGSVEQQEPEITGKIKIEKEYESAKPRRKVIKAKIFSE